MKVILTDDVMGLGDIGTTVKVRPGYARNYLIPRGLAFETSTASAKSIEHRMKQVEAKKRRMKGSAEELASKIRSSSVSLQLKVGVGGRVFGAVHSGDIATKLLQKDIEVDRRRIVLLEPLKKIGTHFVKVKLHPEVEVQLKVDIEGIPASGEEEISQVEELQESSDLNQG